MSKGLPIVEKRAVSAVAARPRLSRMGQIFVAVLLIVVFEGAVRKWISASLTNPIVLLRDVLALSGAIWALQKRHLRSSHLGMQILLIWTATVVVWGLGQLIASISTITVFVIGVRFWLLYLWFGYAAAVSLTEYDFRFITKTILGLLVVMTPLVVVQFILSPGAFLNQQVGGDESTVFRVTADIVRTTGTFSFTAGYSTFLAVVTPFVLSLLTPGYRLLDKRWMAFVCLLALGIATIVSGSRGAIIFLGLMLSVFSVTSLVFAKGSRKAGALILTTGILSIFGGILYAFSRAVNALEERFESAAQSELLSGRIYAMLFGEFDIFANATIIGHGIGMGSNFAGVVATGERTFLLAETEVARTVLEGGFLGVIFIGLKILIIVIGAWKAVSIAKTTGNTLPFLLWVTTALALLSWSIIGQLTINALGYMLFGLAIASLRIMRRQAR